MQAFFLGSVYFSFLKTYFYFVPFFHRFFVFMIGIDEILKKRK